MADSVDHAEEDNEGVELRPSHIADPQEIVRSKIPADILDRYEVYSYRNAAVILSEARKN